MKKRVVSLLTRIRNRLTPKIYAISIDKEKTLTVCPVFSAEKFFMPEMREFKDKDAKIFEGYQKDIPELNLFLLKGGKCIVGNEEVFTVNNRVIGEITSQESNPMVGQRVSKIRKYKKYDGKVLHLSLSGLENNYYHFNVEFLGRWFLFKEANIEVDWIIFPQNNLFQRQFLELLDLDPRKLISENGLVVQADVLVVPQLINNWCFHQYRGYNHFIKLWAPSWLKKCYKTILSSEIKSPTRNKIYISRSKSSYRKVINEEELATMLRNHGFQTVILEELAVREQISLFRNTEIVVAAHGAGLSNISFCFEKVKILELFSQYYHDSSYRIQSVIMGHEYHFMICETPLIGKIHPKEEDLLVDLDRIKKWLLVHDSNTFL